MNFNELQRRKVIVMSTFQGHITEGVVRIVYARGRFAEAIFELHKRDYKIKICKSFLESEKKSCIDATFFDDNNNKIMWSSWSFA